MNFLKYQVPALLWLGIIFCLSSLPGSVFPVIPIPNIDKAVHITIFFILCAVLDRAILHQSRFPRLRAHHLLYALCIVVLYGASDEFHQSFTPQRTMDILDLTADAVGGCLYLVLQYLVRGRRTRKQWPNG